jgi:uncharacterized protein YndB with AHSA1/START domain
MHENETIHLEILINAPATRVWATLTEPELINKWMLDTPIEILTEWQQDGKMQIRGDLYGLPFENRGTIRRFEPTAILEYTHWSTLSLISDIPENYSTLRFEIQAIDKQSHIALTVENLITFEIFKHLQFYWNTALHLLKEVAES